ncbi:MAG: hypothetical protein WCG27_06825, partial [Pseudomonadota bacterium]
PLGEEEKKDELEDPVQQQKVFRRMIIILLLGATVYLMIPGAGDDTQKTKKVTRSARDISEDFSQGINKKSSDGDVETEKKLEEFFLRGQREYREGNYFRAIEEFNLALVLSPNNGRAMYYLNKSKQSLRNDIEINFAKARQEAEALRYRAAAVSYCTILKLLQSYEDDDDYKSAKAGIEEIEKKMGLKKGEIECLQRKSADK